MKVDTKTVEAWLIKLLNKAASVSADTIISWMYRFAFVALHKPHQVKPSGAFSVSRVNQVVMERASEPLPPPNVIKSWQIHQKSHLINELIYERIYEIPQT